MITGGYDDGYSTCDCFWGREPASYVKRIPQLFDSLEKLTALDAGCGEGKNAYYVSELGIDVEAVDISSIAINKTNELWPNNRVNWKIGDLRSYDIRHEYYDIIVSTGSLHCLDNGDQIIDLIRRIKLGTKKGGVNVLSAFNSGLHDFTGHDLGFQPCLLSHNAYLSQYYDWEILDSLDATQEDIHPHTNTVHKHSITRLIARRR